jgi:hypothetical protein
MPKGMVPIYTRDIGGANAVTFTNIPQTYTDLKIVISARAASGTDAAQGLYFQFNGDGSTNYSGITLRNLSNALNAYRTNGGNAFLEFDITNSANGSNHYSAVDLYIPNYTSNIFKQAIGHSIKEDNTTASSYTYNILRANLLKTNAPIRIITIGTNITAPNFAGGSTVTIYGISK